MSNGHVVIPISGSEAEKYSFNDLYSLDGLPDGRFPTLAELRNIIQVSGYELEESGDWTVTSEDGRVDIWFEGEPDDEDTPIEFSFWHGDMIVLDIMQKLANTCGSFLVMDHSGLVAMIITPDSVFGTTSPDGAGFVDVMSQRFPVIFERLPDASLEETLFFLSQISQTLSSLYQLWRYDLYQIAHQGVPVIAAFLTHDDARVRFLAFDLVTTLRQEFFNYTDALAEAITRETDTDTKARMIWSIEDYAKERDTRDEWAGVLRDVVLAVSEDAEQAGPVRLAAANLLARTRLGYLTRAMRAHFVEALVKPEDFRRANGDSLSFVSSNVLKSIEHLLLSHRLSILLEALPRITYAQDAHEVLNALLDHGFFGERRDSRRSPLLDTQEAERPEVGETPFREHQSRDWLYPINPVKNSVADLLPVQRQILETVIALDTPWMVHSNLLQKYGLPPTRSKLRDMLNDEA